MALTQVRWYPPAQTMLERRKASGDSGLEALRILKRRLSDVAYAALRADAPQHRHRRRLLATVANIYRATAHCRAQGGAMPSQRDVGSVGPLRKPDPAIR